MAMNNFSPTGTVDLGGQLAYDLRQTYAKIVGDHLEDIAQARKADNYSIYYKTLKDLFVVISHKVKDKKIKVYDPDKKKDVEKSKLEVYKKLVSDAVAVANANPQTWVGKDKNPESCSKIEQALNAVEMFLYGEIDEAKMFGGGGSIPGL